MKKNCQLILIVAILWLSSCHVYADEAIPAHVEQQNRQSSSQPQVTSQNIPQQEQPTTKDLAQKNVNDITFDQIKKNCTDLAKVVDSLDSQLRSEEFLKQNITIVELNELMNRVQEDLKIRIHKLDRNDKIEILRIIKEKEQVLLKQVKDMEILLRPPKTQSAWKKKLLIAGEIIAGTLLIFSLILATYDNEHETMSWPSWENFRDNFAVIFNMDVTPAPTPIQPHPVATPVQSTPTKAHATNPASGKSTPRGKDSPKDSPMPTRKPTPKPSDEPTDTGSPKEETPTPTRIEPEPHLPAAPPTSSGSPERQRSPGTAEPEPRPTPSSAEPDRTLPDSVSPPAPGSGTEPEPHPTPSSDGPDKDHTDAVEPTKEHPASSSTPAPTGIRAWIWQRLPGKTTFGFRK